MNERYQTGQTDQLTEKEYQSQFTGAKREKALERAWKNRDFEIELYWKRATYFWTFIAAALGGYFLVMKNSELKENFPEAELGLACLGFIFSLAWYLVNLGSKKWQENWEKHIDMLEGDVTGHIYKTVHDKTGYSVSGINQAVSLFVTLFWLSFILYYFRTITFKGSADDIAWLTIGISLITIFFALYMGFGERKKAPHIHIDEKGSLKKISFSLRRFEYINPEHQENEKSGTPNSSN